jgi:hypothetical protein
MIPVLHQELDGKTIAVSHGTGGLRVTVHVSAEYVRPSGTAAGRPVTIEVSGIGVAARGDISDIGQTPQRVVHTRIIEESR